jgi:hypothetical protein
MERKHQRREFTYIFTMVRHRWSSSKPRVSGIVDRLKRWPNRRSGAELIDIAADPRGTAGIGHSPFDQSIAKR